MIVACCVANMVWSVCVLKKETMSKLCSHQTEPPGLVQDAGFGRRSVRKSAYRVTKYQSKAVFHLCLVSVSFL